MKNFISTMKRSMLDRLHFLKIRELSLPYEAVEEFEGLYERFIATGSGHAFTYTGQYPVWQFLHYMIENKHIVVHGSNSSTIDEFIPRESTLFTGSPVKSVFAATDGIWSLFFAVRKKEGYEGSIRNLCLTVPGKKGIMRYYYFSVNEEMGECWTDGTIYFLSRDSFRQGGIRDEWVSDKPVRPLAKMAVTPADFPFLNEVRRHRETDPAWKTILKAMFLKH
ncbi:hypothetical protein [Alteribacter natronophilus]|uniref:hypothetical protein n=1 Tax=Alteribacter natronophilus TaxID=2583810 RepID=UPI00110DA716|nr:hypothetical protein [Alteribacter natronophilus]TMW70951.1 hypothetical protein FGB90_13330 [Alteribacter natronophilus]